MSYTVVFVLVGTAVLLLGVAAGLLWWVQRPLPHHRSRASELPLFGHERAGLWLREDEDISEDEKSELLAARSTRASQARQAWMSEPRAAERRHAEAAAGAAFGTHGGPAVATQSANGSAKAFDPRSYAPPPEPVAPRVTPSRDSAPVRFSIPTDSTLQFLAGRLEIISGDDLGREVRFVRPPAGEPIEVTFGRLEGAPYRHVQLQGLTVSRLHARMHLQGGRWQLTNLSATNPVQHNGEALAVDEVRPLSDGDRIEMGEVVFRFRS
jgi:hypothetical protein